MDPRFDVLGLGVVAVDDLLYVARYPPPDSKEPVLLEERQCGGLTATALVAASRLGARCAYAGILGDDDLSLFVLDRFRAEGIDLAHLVKERGAMPVHSTIIVDASRRTRNIFFHVKGSAGAHPELPGGEVIRSSRVLFIDHYGVEGMIRAARIAREAGIPVVADLERADIPRFRELLDLVDHPILSRDFALRITGSSDPPSSARALWRNGVDTAVVTAGERGCWYVSSRDPSRAVHQPSYPVEVLDTTGCGDVFHGAYAAALARGLGPAERIRFASAAAALKATKPGGQAGIPARDVVERFIQDGERKT